MNRSSDLTEVAFRETASSQPAFTSQYESNAGTYGLISRSDVPTHQSRKKQQRPRACGKLFYWQPGGLVHIRFIPTEVGNLTLAHYPLYTSLGSSPRKWGTRYNKFEDFGDHRFIPMEWGTHLIVSAFYSFFRFVSMDMGTLLPEFELGFNARFIPRMWGTFYALLIIIIPHPNPFAGPIPVKSARIN